MRATSPLLTFEIPLDEIRARGSSGHAEDCKENAEVTSGRCAD